MPLYTSPPTPLLKERGETAKDNFEIGLWKIEEEISFFESKFSFHPEIKNENKKLQWFATRHLVNEMRGEFSEIEKDATGRPFLKNSTQHISISHTSAFAAAVLSKKFPVGIDLEIVNSKVERIAHKFLRQDEINSIHPDEKIEKLILYWSAKETLYKLYGKGGIEFTSQLLIEPFDLKKGGELKAEIIATDWQIKNLKVNYEFFEDHVMTFVCAENN